MKRFLPIGLLVVLLSAACQRNTPLSPIRLQGEAQGTYYSIIYYDSLRRDLSAELQDRFERFDKTASLWVEQSLLRQFNANLTDTVNGLLADLWLKSDSIRRYTQGAFDCRVGRLVQAWGFSFKHREELSTEAIDSLVRLSQGNITLDTTPYGILLMHKEFPSTELDFNAIAQGYTSDLLAAWLDSLGIADYLIDVGGEVIAHGCKPDKTQWSVGIERPAQGKYDKPTIETAIRLENQSVVTSGNYRKYYERDGVRYSHTIDPATGHPVQHPLLSVSVVSRHSWYADAMATAFMVMGLEKALQFIAEHPENPDIQAVYFIYNEQGDYRTYATPAFQQLIIEQ